jgi:hypothetical protein
MPSSKMDDHQRRLDPASPTETDPTEADTRPGCGATTGAWSPQPYFDRLTAAVERLNTACSLSRQLRALADDALTITNEQLAALLGCAKLGQASWLIPVGQIARANSVKAVRTPTPTEQSPCDHPS